MAAIRKEPDIAIGNILGSNVFNLFGILGVSALTVPLTAQSVATVDLAVMIAFALAILPLLLEWICPEPPGRWTAFDGIFRVYFLSIAKSGTEYRSWASLSGIRITGALDGCSGD